MKKMLSTDKRQLLTDEESPLVSSLSSGSDHTDDRNNNNNNNKPSGAGAAEESWLASSQQKGRLVALTVVVAVVVALGDLLVEKKEHQQHKPRIAFIGNSMIYYQDLPRFLETLSQGQMEQNSCLHGGTTLSKILINGNGMFDKFNTSNALLQRDFYDGDSTTTATTIYDYGACTVPQLLFGRDEALQMQVYWKDGNTLEDDGMNPCLQQGRYYDYLLQQQQNPPKWDFIFMNDNTRNPGRNHTRWEGLHVLEHVYLPWIRELKSIPVFLDTHAYWTDQVNLTGLAASVEEMPLFTSYTYEVCVLFWKCESFCFNVVILPLSHTADSSFLFFKMQHTHTHRATDNTHNSCATTSPRNKGHALLLSGLPF